MTKTKLTALQRERFFYVMGMTSGFGASMPQKVFPMLAAITAEFDLEFEKITRLHDGVINPWFEDFLTTLRSLTQEEIEEYAKEASEWVKKTAGGMMFG